MNAFFFAYLPIALFNAFAASHLSCAILKAKDKFRHPELTCFLYCAAGLLLSSLIKLRFFVAGTFLMQFSVLSAIFLFFQGKFRQKLAAFIYFSLAVSLVEITDGVLLISLLYLLGNPMEPSSILLTNDPATLVLIPLVELPWGILFFLKAAPLLHDFLSFFSTRTCILLGLPLVLPLIGQGIIYNRFHSPYFPLLVVLYWVICGCGYPLFFFGIKSLRKQEAQRIRQTRQLELVKKQLEFSKEMEHEYQELRKWNHDVQNHLLSLSYLMEMKNYTEAKAYTTSVLEAENPEHLFTGGHYEGKS